MNALDLVYAEIKRRLDPEMQTRMEQLAGVLLPAVKDGTPLETVPSPPPPGTPAPKTAAARTLIQGLLAVIITAVVGVVTQALTSETFRIFDWGSWAGLGQTALTAAIIAALAFGQRLIGR